MQLEGVDRQVMLPVTGIGGVISRLGGNDRAGVTDRRGFVGRHPGAQQARDRDGGDDADDGHHDQKLDERETALAFYQGSRPSLGPEAR
jgi:hypothetical protein